jgi:hypothetical protein
MAAILGFAALLAAGETRAQTAAPDSAAVEGQAAVDSTAIMAPAAPRPVAVEDTLGIPGRLRGVTTDPASVKATLSRMGSNEIEGRTQWERKKNPRVAMICSMVLPGLGQTYNGRRLKVGLMVGFTSFYAGNMWLNYRRYEAALVRRDNATSVRDEQYENRLADFYKEEARTYAWWTGAVWLIGLLDSWIDAHLYDVRAYTPPAPPESVTPRAVNERTGYLTLGFGLEFSK